MPSDKANKFQTELASFPTVHSLDDRKNATTGSKQNNVFPLDTPKNGINAMEHADERRAEKSGPNSIEQVEIVPADVKSRVDSVLSRVKSEGKAEMGEGDLDLTGASERRGVEVPRSEESHLSTTADLQQALPGHNFKSVLAELERRRTELFAMARGAEARAREAEDKHKQAETRLEREVAQRLMAEQRLREMEEEYLHRLSAAEAEELKRLEVEMAREDAVSRLKEAETRFKEAEIRVREAEARYKEESDMRSLVESTLTEAETKVNALTFAIAEAEHKWTEAESKITDAESRARAAEEKSRGVEELITEADGIAQTAKDKARAIEAKLQQEAELRAVAELKLKSLEDELSSYLDADWSKMDPDLAQMKSTNVTVGALAEPVNFVVGRESEEEKLQLKAELENEQRHRSAAEEARQAMEAKLQEVEAELRKVEGKHRQAEAGLKKILRKQEAELRNLSEQVVRPSNATASITWVEPGEGDGNVASQLAEPISSNAKIKLVVYGAILMLLLVLLGWALMEVYTKLV